MTFILRTVFRTPTLNYRLQSLEY